MSVNKIFTVDKFLGLNESEDGATELKMGEASVIENFTITDGGNLKLRDGVSRLVQYAENENIIGLWQGLIGKYRYAVCAVSAGEFLWIESIRLDSYHRYEFAMMVEADTTKPVKIFPFGKNIYCIYSPASEEKEPGIIEISATETGSLELNRHESYIPLAITGSTPAGDGTTNENLNILSRKMRVQFSSDGLAIRYVLPENVSSVESVTVDSKPIEIGMYQKETHSYIFTDTNPPPKGVGNVEFVCVIEDEDLDKATEKFLSMRYQEAYNGATDTRMFFYGDGTNICYYTGVPAFGDGIYLPAGNEIGVDATASAVTAMCRDHSRLIAFKEDSTFSITYEPMTLADGSVIAGFTVRPVHRDLGCDVTGQVELVDNYPRTICKSGIYDWKIASYSYKDERYAKCISDRVQKTLANADVSMAISCDDTAKHTYYLFLNDDKGTVLVHRYNIDIWTIYRGEVFKNIKYANASASGKVLFSSDRGIYYFDKDSTYDIAPDSNELHPITAAWESGFMAFGADFRRKYSSTIWVSILPESFSEMDITVSTDKRDSYRVKQVGYNLFSFKDIDFSNFSFSANYSPKIDRVRIKVKKFIYYKMIFRVTKPGARATILGYDQQVRFSSLAK